MKINLCKAFKRKQLRKTISSFNQLSKSNELFKINDILEDFLENPIALNISGEFKSEFDKSCNQYLLSRFSNHALLSSLVTGLTNPKNKVICILPPKWLKIVSAHGIKVDYFLSIMSFILIIFLYFGYGVISFLKILLEGLWSKSDYNKDIDLHFSRLDTNNLPKYN